MAHRFPHALKDNKGTSFPSQLVFLDVETDNFEISPDEEEVRLKLGYAKYVEREKKVKVYEREEWKYFDIDVDLFEWFYNKLRNKRTLYLISANIWFDLRVSGLLRLFLVSDFRCINYFVKGLSQIFIFESGQKKIVCLNFQNFFRLSVKQIGEVIGREKKEVDFKTVSREELSSYCQEDVRIIADAFKEWESFISQHDLGTFGRTLPSQAFNSFRHRFMKSKIYVHNSEVASRLERSAYYGGRTECFFIGRKANEPFYYLDINSFYPYVMKRFEYPTRLIFYDDECSLKNLERLIQSGCTIAKVNLTSPDPIYPTKYNNRTIFPVGTFDTELCTEGLRRELAKGNIRCIYEVAHYESARIFEDYVDYFWGLKAKYGREKKTGWEFICKMFLNSLYGKFGQQNDEVLWEKECDPEEFYREVIFHIDTGQVTVITRFAGMEREVRQGASEAMNSFVGICSHVTEYARLLLWDYIVKAGRENVYYCDTDSLIVNEKGKRKLARFISPGSLGGFKIVEEADSFTIRAAKDYVFGSRSKIKGIRANAEMIDEDTFRQVEFPGYLGELKKGLRPLYYIRYTTKRLSRKYEKGVILDDGRVVPFELNQKYEDLFTR